MTTILKYSMQMTQDIQSIPCLTQKMNHIFNENKYYCLFLIYTKQLSLFSYMTVRKTLHIKSWTRLFRWGVYLSLDQQICTLSSESKGFLKKKAFFIFKTMLSFKQVESNYGKKEHCERSCSRIVLILDALIWYYFFQFELEVAVEKKWITEVNNFWYFFKKI